MKRSEAIAIISNFIYELNVDSDECDAESEKILKALEEAGMKPPGHTEYEGFGSGDEYECYSKEVNEWEEE